jgi:negative regulator of replication initiation
MRTIRIDDDVWRGLQRRATPFEDTPNCVLRRLLKLDAAKKACASRGSKRPPMLDRTPQQAYRQPILEALLEFRGAAAACDVLERVREKMQGILKPADHEKLASGMVRWRNTAMWERSAMVQQGLLKADSPRGHWEISDRGRASVRLSGERGGTAA